MFTKIENETFDLLFFWKLYTEMK